MVSARFTPKFSLKFSAEELDWLLQASYRSVSYVSKELNDAGKDLTTLNQSFKALMNSLGQGFLVFDSNGICNNLFSEACIELLEGDPSGRPIVDILQISEEKREAFLGWVQLLFSGVMDFEDLAVLGPKTFPSILGKQIDLEYKPILGDQGEVVGVVMFAIDNTDQLQAKEEARRKQNYVDMVLKITKDRNQFVMFVQQVRSMIAFLADTANGKVEVDLGKIRRLLHTIKGGAASFYIQSIKNMAHQFETEIDEITKHRKLEKSSKTGEKEEEDPEFLKSLLPQVENYGVQLELELANFLTQHQNILGEDFEKTGYEKTIRIQALMEFWSQLDKRKGCEDLSLSFLKDLVAVPIKQSFLQFDSIVQSVADKVGKKVKPIEFVGEDVGILSNVYEKFFAAAIHLFSNSVVHGIESPEERELLKKNKAGSITVIVSVEKSDPTREWLKIVVQDDGRGINPAIIRAKLKEKGFGAKEAETDEQVIQHIFDAAFSTKDSVNDMAGRGIGLSAVLEEVRALGGSIWASTILGTQTSFQIRLPYLWTGVTP